MRVGWILLLLPFSSSHTSVTSGLNEWVNEFCSFIRWKWFYLRVIIEKSADDHCLAFKNDGAMSIASLVQIGQFVPLIVLEFSNNIFCINTTNDINCIRCLSRRIIRNSVSEIRLRILTIKIIFGLFKRTLVTYKHSGVYFLVQKDLWRSLSRVCWIWYACRCDFFPLIFSPEFWSRDFKILDYTILIYSFRMRFWSIRTN